MPRILRRLVNGRELREGSMRARVTPGGISFCAKATPRSIWSKDRGRADNGRAGRSSQRSSLTILPQPAWPLALKSPGHPQQPCPCRTPLGAFSFRVWTDYEKPCHRETWIDPPPQCGYLRLT